MKKISALFPVIFLVFLALPISTISATETQTSTPTTALIQPLETLPPSP